MIAYFILVHRYPEQFKRLFKAIHVPGNHYVIHVDKTSDLQIGTDIAAFLKDYPNAAMLDSRNALWGGYSLVDAELRGMHQLLEMGQDWDYFINLSGQDFPLKTQDYIEDFLIRNAGKQFIRAVDQRVVRPETMNRLSHYFIEAFSQIIRTGVPRRYLKGVTPYIGTQWKVVTRSFCDFVCHDRAADRFKHFYEKSFIADEGFFQTVMMNAFPDGAVVNDDLRTIDWVPDGDIKLRPRTFTARDALRLTLSPDLFARKFDSTEDAEILDLLEEHLLTPRARIVPAETEPLIAIDDDATIPSAC